MYARVRNANATPGSSLNRLFCARMIGGERGAAFIICDSQKVGRESRKLRYLPGHAPQPYGCMQRIRAVESRQIVTSVLRHHGRGGVSMAPTAYATAADDVSKSARL